MKQCALVLTVFLGLVSGAFAQNIDSQLKDTISAGSNIRHSTTNLQVDTVNPKEGADISVDYLWSLSTFLGEPILKCNAAWKLNGVYIKSKPQGSVGWIAAKDLPPKVAASVKIVDLDVLASSMYFKVSFECDNGVMAAQGKERSWNIPTSPDWHEVLGKGYSKEQAIKENKEKYKAMLSNKNAVATLFEYSVRNVEFDLSGVRDWLAEENKKAAEAEAKLLDKKLAPNPKQAKGKPVKVKPEEVEKRKSAIAEKIAQTEEMRKLSQDERNGATKTVEAKRSELVEREKELGKPKLIAGRYRDNGDGTVSDVTTKLMWQKCPDGFTLEANKCIAYDWKAQYRTLEQAKSIANNNYAGKSGWRLPSIKEFDSFVYCSAGSNESSTELNKDLSYKRCNEKNSKSPYWNINVFPEVYYIHHTGKITPYSWGGGRFWTRDFLYNGRAIAIYDFHSAVKLEGCQNPAKTTTLCENKVRLVRDE